MIRSESGLIIFCSILVVVLALQWSSESCSGHPFVDDLDSGIPYGSQDESLEEDAYDSRHANVSPYAGSSTSPKPGTKTTPKPGTKTTPKPGTKTTPKPGPTTSPKPGTKTTPKPGTKTTPKPGPTTSPKPGTKTSPKPSNVTIPSRLPIPQKICIIVNVTQHVTIPNFSQWKGRPGEHMCHPGACFKKTCVKCPSLCRPPKPIPPKVTTTKGPRVRTTPK